MAATVPLFPTVAAKVPHWQKGKRIIMSLDKSAGAGPSLPTKGASHVFIENQSVVV